MRGGPSSSSSSNSSSTTSRGVAHPTNKKSNNNNRSNKQQSTTTSKKTLSATTKQQQQRQQQQPSSSSWWWEDQSYYTSSITNKLILTSVLSQFLPVPLLLLPFLHLVYGCLVSLRNMLRGNSDEEEEEEDDDDTKRQKITSSAIDEEETTTIQEDYSSYEDTIDIDDYDPIHHIQVRPSPALTTLLDTGLYKAYQAELVPTVSAASQLLQLYIELKEGAALVLRECRWSVGVPLCGGLKVTTIRTTIGQKKKKQRGGSSSIGGRTIRLLGQEVVDDGYLLAVGGGSQNVFLGGGVVVDEMGKNYYHDGTSTNNSGGGGGGVDYATVLQIVDDNETTIHGASLLLQRGTSGGSNSVNNSAVDSTINYSSSSGNSKEARMESVAAMEVAKWNEFDTIQDFAQQCYLIANEAIQRLSTDRLSDSANLTVHDGMSGDGGGGGGGSGNNRDGNGNHPAAVPGDAALNHHDQSQNHPSMPSSTPTAGGSVGPSSSSSSSSSAGAQSSSSMLPRTLADAGIGRCYEPLTRQDCWESPRLYCPDYTWADDAIGACQRSLKILSKHRFLTLVATNGWDRYISNTTMSASPQQDGVHSIPTPTYASATPHPFPSLEAVHCLQYLVSELLQTSIPSSINKFRAATEANAVVSKRLYLVKCEYRAPMRALWESYTALNAAPRLELVERYLRDYHGVKPGEEQDTSPSHGGKSNVLKKKLSSDASKKSALLLQQQREKMEKLITEKYWKHPIFVEALQLERCCEKLEMDMSQMLLPLSNLAREMMDEWKGRLRAVAVVRDGDSGKKLLQPYIHWHQLPGWRELLMRLKSILCRKPGHGESTGIRPFLLDLQGVPRHNKDALDSSIEVCLYQPLEKNPRNPYAHVEEFVTDAQVLQKVLNIPGVPVLAEERLSGSKSDKDTMLDLVKKFNEVWDEEMFLAQYKDWYDLVKRQQELNAGTLSEDGEQQPSLSELAEAIRETEIELISPPAEDATAEFPELSQLGLFGDQLTMSGEA
eukprot:scaffold1812_cov153-Skeletonema_menzelii.AAC.14